MRLADSKEKDVLKRRAEVYLGPSSLTYRKNRIEKNDVFARFWDETGVFWASGFGFNFLFINVFIEASWASIQFESGLQQRAYSARCTYSWASIQFESGLQLYRSGFPEFIRWASIQFESGLQPPLRVSKRLSCWASIQFESGLQRLWLTASI